MLSRRDLAIVETGSGLLTMIGGILLVLPGFLTDVAGLLLLLPAAQKMIDRGPFRRTRPSGRVLELDRSQWHDIHDTHITDGSKPDDGRKPRS